MVAKIGEMRGDDKRLIITESLPEMDKIRNDESSACNSGLPTVIGFLTAEESEESIYKKGQAATLLSLCSHSNPAFRAKIGTEGGVAVPLVQMVQKAKDLWTKGEEVASTYQYLDVAALAAEAIWALVENSAENHRAFVDAGAVEALGGFIVASKEQNEGEGACKFANNKDGASGRSPCHFVRMWAAAALENLSSNYCDNGEECDGHDEYCGLCFYEWDDEGKLLLSVEEGEEVKYTVSAGGTREALANMDGLVEELLHIVCEVEPDREHEREHPYPTESLVGRDDGMPSTVGWAAAGILKNLALEDKLRPMVATEDAYNCFCEMSGSFDWLEADKAEDAVFHIGRDDDCLKMMEKKFMGDMDFGGGDYDDDDYSEDDYSEDESYDDEEAAHGGEL